MNTYSVIMLGPSGSGKTVFLASLYKKLSIQGEHGFFLEVDGSEKRKRLNNIYTQIAIDEKWPKGTTYSEISEWTFTCRVQTENLPIYSACKFNYLDYAGGRITDEMEEDSEFDDKLNDADALLGLLDAQRICAFMQNEKVGMSWAINDLPNMLDIMQNTSKPIHFIISKWDILEGKFTLEQIRNRLLEIDEFKNLIKQRTKAGTPVRLIPVSAVGMGFAELQPDGSMAKTGKLPKPFQVEVPLACILPDMIQTKLHELIEKQQELNTPIEVKPSFSLWDRVRNVFGSSLKFVQQLLPKKYQFAEDILEKIIVFAEESTQKKQEAARKRSDELFREQEASLKAVANEETALKHVINCFLSIRNKLDYTFPESDITLR